MDDIDMAKSFLQDIIDSYCEGSDHQIATIDLALLYELASMYEGLRE